MNVDLVPPVDVDKIWPLIARRVADCIQKINADCSAGDLWTMSRSGALFLIIAHEDDTVLGATMWRFETWAHGTVFKNIITVGERMKEWFPDMQEKVNEMAANGGADHFVWQGSPAWRRLIPNAKTMTCNYIMEVRHG